MDVFIVESACLLFFSFFSVILSLFNANIIHPFQASNIIFKNEID